MLTLILIIGGLLLVLALVAVLFLGLGVVLLPVLAVVLDILIGVGVIWLIAWIIKKISGRGKKK